MKSKAFTFYTDAISYKAEETPDGKSYIIDGYISTPDLDLVNDLVTEKALKEMKEQLMDRSIKLDFEHESFRGDNETEMQINKTKMPLGRIIDQQKDTNGIRIVAELNPSWKKFDSKGDVVMDFRDVWSSIKKGFYDAFSIAFVPTNTSITQKNGQSIRLLDGINLLNVAITGNPVNTHAKMLTAIAKSLDYLQTNSKGDIMANEPIKKDEEQPEVPPENEEQKDATLEAKEQTEEKSEPEQKDNNDAIAALEVKNAELAKANKELTEKVDAMLKAHEELKAELAKPIQKGKSENMKAEIDKAEPEAKSLGPLDTLA